MEVFEKVWRLVFMVLAGALFGWVFALLALESAWRRWRSNRAAGATVRLEAAYQAYPKTRPTQALRRATSW